MNKTQARLVEASVRASMNGYRVCWRGRAIFGGHQW